MNNKKIFGLGVLLIALALIVPVYADADTNVTLLYGYNGTQWVPIKTLPDGTLDTTLNLSESIALNPKLNNTYDLGTAALLWANLYVRSLRGGSGPLSLFAGSTEAVTILPSGYVGIGTTNPQFMLDVKGVINASGILVNGSAVSGGGTAAGWSENATNVYVYNNTAGIKVGIGTNEPANALTVIGTVNATSFIGDGSELTGVSTSNVSLEYGYNGSNFVPLLTTGGGVLRMGVEQSNLVTTSTLTAGATGSDLTLSGNLIAANVNVTGTSTNSTFSGDVRIFGTLYGGSPVKIAGGLNVTGGIIYNTIVNTVDNLSLNINNTLYVNGSNVGIGTSSPNYKLDVNGVINASGILINNSALTDSTGPWQSFRGLHLSTGEQGNSATTVTLIHADEIITSNGVRRTPADNLAATITTSGINGLRASQSEAASTWYKVMYAYGTSGEGLYLEQAKDYFLDQSFETTVDGFVSVRSGGGETKIAQGVTFATAGKVEFVDIYLKGTATAVASGNAWITLEADNSGNPSGTPLATSKYLSATTLTSMSASGRYIRFIFRTPHTVSASTQYHIVLQGDWPADWSGWVEWGGVTAGGYSGGVAKTYSGSWAAIGVVDFDFKAYVTRNDNTVTLPSGYNTGYAQISWVYNNASSDFVPFVARQRHVWALGVPNSYVTTTTNTQILTNISANVPPVPVDLWAYIHQSTGTAAHMGFRSGASLGDGPISAVYQNYPQYGWTEVMAGDTDQFVLVGPGLVEFQSMYIMVSNYGMTAIPYFFEW